MTAIDMISFLHTNMKKTYRPDDQVECHAAILKDWHRNDAWLPEDCPDPLRAAYDDSYAYYCDHEGFHDFCCREDKFLAYINKAEQDAEEDVYFSINSFWTTKRTEANIRHLNAFVIDYDFYKLDEYKHLDPEEMYRTHIKNSLPLKPSFVIDSGRGLYCLFAIEHVPCSCTSLYKAICTRLIESQKRFGADSKATLTTQVIRIPGSINGRSGRPVRVLDASEKRYTISDFADLYLPFSRAEVRDYKKAKSCQMRSPQVSRKSKSNRSSRQNSQFSIFESDLKTLIEMRNKAGICSGYRETLLYLYWERAAKCGLANEAIEKKILYLNSRFMQPLPQTEALTRCKPAREYVHVTSKRKAIRKLEISPNEQELLFFLVSARRDMRLRKARSRKKTKICGKTPAAQKRHERRCQVLRGLACGKSAKELAETLGVVRKTILSDCEYIRRHYCEFSDIIKSLSYQEGNNLAHILLPKQPVEKVCASLQTLRL